MTPAASNPLAERSHLPYQLPDFAALTPAHYREAFEVGMDQQLEALDAGPDDSRPVTESSTPAPKRLRSILGEDEG